MNLLERKINLTTVLENFFHAVKEVDFFDNFLLPFVCEIHKLAESCVFYEILYGL